MNYKISMVLDKRRQLQNNEYPLKLRVWIKDQKKGKRITTGIGMHETHFNKCWGLTLKATQKLTGIDRENFIRLKNIYDKAIDIADGMDYFDLEVFEGKLFRKASDKTSVQYRFNKSIEELRKTGRIGTASSYESAITSLIKYEKEQRPNKMNLSFMEVSPDWLRSYESYMVDKNGCSFSTVGMYLRALRAMFNIAIQQSDINEKYYPFGKGKYEIPASSKVKKSLSQDQVREFYNAKLPMLQDRARDYWFFSYACNGMNFKDIAMMKFGSISEGQISYYREKTRRNKRTDIKPIVINLNEVSLKILDKYKTVYRGDKAYVFPILKDNDSPEIIFKKVNNWIRATNQQLKHVAKEYGYPTGFSTYWARHGFANNIMNMGASVEFISQALNHSDISVTQNYLGSFEDRIKNELTEKLIAGLK